MGETCDDDDDDDCSSSFADTGSCTKNDSAFSDDEVVSYLYAKDPFSSIFYQDCEPALMRWKKLTSHWESFIRPLAWRCKWIELKLKQLQSQEHEYEKELAPYDYRRQVLSANMASDGCDLKSIPLPEGINGKKVFKRKKRKTVEETCSLASYTSGHCVLSCFEEKDSLKNGNSLLKLVKEQNPEHDNEESNGKDIFSHLENDLFSCLHHNDTDRTLAKIFDRIESVQCEVQELRARIGKVVNENAGKSSSVNNLNTPGLGPPDSFNLHDPNSASCSAIKNTLSARNQFIEKTKRSVGEKKSVPHYQESAPDLVAKNDCYPSKSDLRRKKRGTRKKSGSNWGAGNTLAKPNSKKVATDQKLKTAFLEKKILDAALQNYFM